MEGIGYQPAAFRCTPHNSCVTYLHHTLPRHGDGRSQNRSRLSLVSHTLPIVHPANVCDLGLMHTSRLHRAHSGRVRSPLQLQLPCGFRTRMKASTFTSERSGAPVRASWWGACCARRFVRPGVSGARLRDIQIGAEAGASPGCPRGLLGRQIGGSSPRPNRD